PAWRGGRRGGRLSGTRFRGARDTPAMPAELAACPHLSHLRGLHLESQLLSTDELATLLGSPYRANLPTLELSRNSRAVPAGAAAVVAALTHLTRVTHLYLSESLLDGVAGTHILASAPH